MVTLNKAQIVWLHRKMMEATGGSGGIHDESRLESALAVPLQPSYVEVKIARTAYNLVRNRPFADGNKRIGVYVMLALLELNHIKADFTDGDIVKIGLGLATGEMEYKHLLRLILKHIKEGIS